MFLIIIKFIIEFVNLFPNLKIMESENQNNINENKDLNAETPIAEIIEESKPKKLEESINIEVSNRSLMDILLKNESKSSIF